MKVKVASYITLFCLVIFAAACFFYCQLKDFTNDNNVFSFNNKYKYHFVEIVQNTHDPFWQQLKNGAMKAAKKFNIGLEVNGPNYTNPEEELQYLDMAIDSKVDGIITHVYDEKKFMPLINKAIKLGIPVITIQSDSKNSLKHLFIGTSNFQIGQDEGELLSNAVGKSAHAALILNTFNNTNKTDNKDLISLGLNSEVSNKKIKITTFNNSNSGEFAAREVARNLINLYPDLQAIICTNSDDTVEVAQTLVDLNKVGTIKIIGFGDTEEILNYIKIGVIYGTVAIKAKDMGYDSVQMLYDIKNKKSVASYVDTGEYVITQKDIKKYNLLQ